MTLFQLLTDSRIIAPTLLLVLAGGLIVYHHFVYPVLIRRLSRRLAGQHPPQAPVLYPVAAQAEAGTVACEAEANASGDARAPGEDRAPGENSATGEGTAAETPPVTWPAISLLIPVYNEGALVAEKLRNLAIVDYPADRLTIHLLFDGCTDDSVQQAQNALQEALCRDLNCILQVNPVNQGKLSLLNQAISDCHDEIVALSDLSALIAVDSLKIAALWFQQHNVGAVCATYRFLSDAQQQEKSYWHYQCAIKQAESDLGSTFGAHGAFYLIRRSLFKPLAADTINDDFMLPCEMIRQGYRVVYEPRMIAIELESSNLEQDFKRRLRISAGNLQQSLRLTDLVTKGRTGWMFFSCKWIRPFIPWCFVVCLIASVWLTLISLWFSPILVLQLVVYALVLLQTIAPRNSGLLIKLHYLISGHAIGLVGGLCYLRGDFRNSWRKGDDL